MKCKTCGYEYAIDYSSKKPEVIGDEEFISIIGTFYIKRDWERDERVKLVACPKCKTVILNY